MAGFIVLPRDIQDTPLWKNATFVTRDVMITLMLNVCWQDTEWNEYGKTVTLHPGQIVTTAEFLRFKCARGASLAQVKYAIKYLSTNGFLSVSKLGRRSLITLPWWEESQSIKQTKEEVLSESLSESSTEENPMKSQSGDECSTSPVTSIKEPLTINHKPLTNKQDRSAAKGKRGFTRPPSKEEVKSYIEEKGLAFDADSFVDYYEANGWKVGKNPMKDWRAAARNWDRRRREAPLPRQPPDFENYVKETTGGKDLRTFIDERDAQERARLMEESDGRENSGNHFKIPEWSPN